MEKISEVYNLRKCLIQEQLKKQEVNKACVLLFSVWGWT